MSARALQSRESRVQSPSRGREVLGIVLLASAIFLGVSLLSLMVASGTWLGPGGAVAASAMYTVLGLGSFVVAYTLARTGARVLSGRQVGLRGVDTFGGVLAVVACCVLLDVGFHEHRLVDITPGGMLGEAIAQLSI